MDTGTTPHRFLPITQHRYHILLALGHGTTHGYALMESLESRTSGQVVMLPGTLYTNLAGLLADGLVEEVTGRDYPVRGGRRRYYRSTELGRAVARAESRRLASVVALARAEGFLEEDRLGEPS